MAQRIRSSSHEIGEVREDDNIGAYPPSPSLAKRVLRYDCKDGAASVVRASEIRPEALADAKIIELPGGMKEVALFVDANTQKRVSTDPDNNKESNLLLAKIHLDRLNAKSRHTDGLRQVYVQNVSYLLTTST